MISVEGKQALPSALTHSWLSAIPLMNSHVDTSAPPAPAGGFRFFAPLRAGLLSRPSMSRLLTIVSAVLALLLAGADVASGQTASRVIRLIDQRCANCHRNPGTDRAPDVAGAPEPATLRQMAPETILQAITTGAMRVRAEGVVDEVKRAMAEYMSGRKLGDPAAGDARRCRTAVRPVPASVTCPPCRHGTGGDPMQPTRASRRPVQPGELRIV